MRLLSWIRLTVALLILLYADAAFPGNSWQRWQQRSGPISVVSQSPIQLLFLQPIPDRADTLPSRHGSIRLSTTFTNTLFSKESEHYAATVDTEMVRTSLELSYGVLPNLELGLSLPAAHYYAGFMDHPIRDVERIFGGTRAIRAQQEADQFTCFVKKNGKILISASENTTGMGDLVLRAKAKLRDESDVLPALSTRFALKLPTGDEDRAFGSGEPDWGWGLLLQKDINRTSLYLNADVTFPGDAFDDAGVSLTEFYSVMIGLEYRFTPRLYALAQMSWITRPFEDTGLDILDRRIYDLLMGLNYNIGEKMFIQAGGVEDIIDSCDATSDFTFFVNAGLNF